MPPKSRGPAPPQSRPSSQITNKNHLTRLLGLERHEPLTPEDRADIDVIIAAAERGFRLATKCAACGHWISAPSSVRQHVGPVCAKRAAKK